MSLNRGSSRKSHSLENWRDFGGSLPLFDQNNWRQRGLYEDLSNATKCGISQVGLVLLTVCSLSNVQMTSISTSSLVFPCIETLKILTYADQLLLSLNSAEQNRKAIKCDDFKFKRYGQ